MTITNLPATNPTKGTTEDVSVVQVSPSLAAMWLAQNVHNRKLREAEARLYAQDMQSGDWRWTGDAIKFSIDGTLLDGQHRLRAVVLAGITVPMLVVRGLAPEAQEDIDGGIPRKMVDVLTLRGEADASALAAAVRKVHGWNNGDRRRLNATKATKAQLLRTLDAHPELREVVRRARAVAGHCEVPASVVALAMWVFDQIDLDDSTAFFDRLASGEGFKGDPIFELRRTLQGTKSVRGERSQTYMLAITIKAWNAYRNGETVGLYRWRPGGSKPEAFPEPA